MFISFFSDSETNSLTQHDSFQTHIYLAPTVFLQTRKKFIQNISSM